MIPSITASSCIPAFLTHDINGSLLTIDHVIQSTSRYATYRYLEAFSWFEDEHIASLNARVDFINLLVREMTIALPDRTAPVTLISFGAGGLLMEYFIHAQLNACGYRHLSWRVIDLDYPDNGTTPCLYAFSQYVNNHVIAFATEQDYLNHAFGNNRLAESDRAGGATVVLSIDPPTILSNASAAGFGPDYLFIKGRPVSDVAKANAIYVLVAPWARKQMLDDVPVSLRAGKQLVATNCVLMCSLDKFNHIAVKFSPSDKGWAINKGVEPYLASLCAISAQHQQEIKLVNIDKALEKYLEKLTPNDMYGLKFYVSDYDTSVVNLHHYFGDGQRETLFASFDKNITCFEKKS